VGNCFGKQNPAYGLLSHTYYTQHQKSLRICIVALMTYSFSCQKHPDRPVNRVLLTY
jgi:hypothetical protein